MAIVRISNTNGNTIVNNTNKAEVPNSVTIGDRVVVHLEEMYNEVKTTELGRDTYRAVRAFNKGQFKTLDEALAHYGLSQKVEETK